MSGHGHQNSGSAGLDPAGSTSISLIARVQARDPEAWQRLIDLYGPLVYGWCRQSGLQAEDAADVVQEVFCAVAGHVARFRRERPGDSFRAWLRTIARNKLCDHFRRLGRQPQARGGTTAQQNLAQIAQPDPDWLLPEDGRAAEGDLWHRAMELVRAEFEPRTWEAFWRLAIERRSGAEVARELGITLPAAYQAKYRVLKRLRRELDEPPP